MGADQTDRERERIRDNRTTRALVTSYDASYAHSFSVKSVFRFAYAYDRLPRGISRRGKQNGGANFLSPPFFIRSRKERRGSNDGTVVETKSRLSRKPRTGVTQFWKTKGDVRCKGGGREGGDRICAVMEIEFKLGISPSSRLSRGGNK